MINLVQILPAGNALRIFMIPPTNALRVRLLRKNVDSFDGPYDSEAVIVSDSKDRNVIDFLGVDNGVKLYYRAYYFTEESGWIETETATGTPAATLADVTLDVLTLLRSRLELGLQVFVKRGALAHTNGYIPVLTASPMVDDMPLPVVTVHLSSDSPEIRAIGETIGEGVFEQDEENPYGGFWTTAEAWYSRVTIEIVGWCLNADERIDLRKAMKAVIIGNLPVFEAAGLMQVDASFQDREDFTSYAAPIYQALCNFSCIAPSAVESETRSIHDVVINFNT